MNINTLTREIMTGDFTNTDLDAVIQAVKFARTQLGEKNKRSITIGCNVNFTSSRTGRNITGVVTKIAVKNVTVRTVDNNWLVPANMLTVVED